MRRLPFPGTQACKIESIERNPIARNHRTHMNASQSLTIKAFLAALSQLDESKVADLPPELQQFDWVQDTDRLDRLARDSILGVDYQSARQQLRGGPAERSKSIFVDGEGKPDRPQPPSTEVKNRAVEATNLNSYVEELKALEQSAIAQINEEAHASANPLAAARRFLANLLT